MDHKKQQSGGSSFTDNLFGPKDSSSATSSGVFSTVFGPSSTRLGRHTSHCTNTKNQEFGCPYGSGKPDYKLQRSTGRVYENETSEPSNLSSSIYYGGQEVYSPNTRTTRPPHTLKKDGGDTDSNGSSASRGNWWKGSLYY